MIEVVWGSCGGWMTYLEGIVSLNPSAASVSSVWSLNSIVS